MKLRPIVWITLLSLIPLTSGAGIVHSISAEEWARPRHGERMVRMPAVSETVQAWMISPDRQILIHYPGGEDGTIWAEELRAWLVALGVASSHIEMQAGMQREDRIELSIQR